MNAPQSITHTPCTLNKVTVCTVAYDDGWWVFTVPGEGSRRVIDSRQARSEVGMLMNPWEVDPEDDDDWAEFGPCVIRHTPIPERKQEKAADGEEGGDTSGDNEPDGSHETHDPEDDREPGLARKHRWQLLLDPAFWTHVHGVQSRNTGTVGDDHMLRAIDRDCAACKAHIAALKSKSRHSKHKLAYFEEMLADLRKRRQEYVNPLSGGHRPFYPNKETENLVKGIRMMLLRAIRSSVARDSKASVALIHAINRGMHLGYTPDPHWEWRVMPFERKRLPRMVGQADKKAAA